MKTWEKVGIKFEELKKFPFRVFNFSNWTAKYCKTIEEAQNKCNSINERIEAYKESFPHKDTKVCGYEPI